MQQAENGRLVSPPPTIPAFSLTDWSRMSPTFNLATSPNYPAKREVRVMSTVNRPTTLKECAVAILRSVKEITDVEIEDLTS